MDTPTQEITAKPASTAEPEMPKNDVLFVEVPPAGFELTAIQKYIRGGYSLWGVVPVVNKASELVLPDGVEVTPLYYLVLKLDVNAIPVNLLAHHIVRARSEKGGLNQLAETFFGLSLQQLEDGLKKAQASSNDRR